MKAQIKEFMRCTGNDYPSYDGISKKYLLKKVAQLKKLLDEEVVELQEALDEKDIVEIVDAIGDIDVYHTQLVLLLEAAGIDYKGIQAAIAENNSLKYTTSAELAERWLNEHQSDGNFNYYVSGTEVNSEMYYCLKDVKNGKVKKWKGFTSVDLKPFIPSKYLGKEWEEYFDEDKVF